MVPILQRFRDDCSICCMAMLVSWSYERMLAAALMIDAVPRWQSGFRAVGYTPGGGTKSPFQLLSRLGFDVQCRNFSEAAGSPGPEPYVRGRPAILSVPSKTGWRGWHDVFWDGQQVIDPRAEPPHYESAEALKAAINIILLEVA